MLLLYREEKNLSLRRKCLKGDGAALGCVLCLPAVLSCSKWVSSDGAASSLSAVLGAMN